MTPHFYSVTPKSTLIDAAQMMVEKRIHRVFVVDGTKPVGVCSTKDLMRAVMDAKIQTPISAMMTVPVVIFMKAYSMSMYAISSFSSDFLQTMKWSCSYQKYRK